MENTEEVFEQLFSLVDRIRHNNEILKTLNDPETIVRVGLPDGPNLVTDTQAEYVKANLIDRVSEEQADVWKEIQEMTNANSPFQ